MLTCVIGSSIVNLLENKYDRYQLKNWSDKNILKCPVCGGQYEYCHGEIVDPYFRHRDKDCLYYYSESETDEHRKGKEILYTWLSKQEGISNLKLEYWIPETKQRPDVYFEYGDKRFVVEYQCTPISSELKIRRKLYSLSNINDIWIMGTEKYDCYGSNGSLYKEKGRKYIESVSDYHLNSENGTMLFDSNNVVGLTEYLKIQKSSRIYDFYYYQNPIDDFKFRLDNIHLSELAVNIHKVEICKKIEEKSKKIKLEKDLNNFKEDVIKLLENNKNKYDHCLIKNSCFSYEKGFFIYKKSNLAICLFFKSDKIGICECLNHNYRNICSVSYNEFNSSYELYRELENIIDKYIKN